MSEPVVAVESLTRDVAALGIAAGARVLVHSSLGRSVAVEHGADGLVDALLGMPRA